MSDFRIKTYVLGGVSTNCYLVFREGEKTAVIIDPADNADYLKNKCREFGVKPEAVLLTHAHFDHMLAADDIRKAYGCKVYVHMDDERMLNDPFLNLSGTMGTEQTGISADHLLRDGDVLHFLNREWLHRAIQQVLSAIICRRRRCCSAEIPCLRNLWDGRIFRPEACLPLFIPSQRSFWCCRMISWSIRDMVMLLPLVMRSSIIRWQLM